MAVLDVRERTLPVSADVAGALLDGLASPDDQLWPSGSGAWPPMWLDRPLGEGAKAGHEPVRYTVTGYAPGRWVQFRFTAPAGFHGFHEFTVHSAGPQRSVLRHTLAMRARGPARLSWPLVFGPLHRALLEDSLDRAELACAGAVSSPARWSRYVRLLRWLIQRGNGPQGVAGGPESADAGRPGASEQAGGGAPARRAAG